MSEAEEVQKNNNEDSILLRMMKMQETMMKKIQRIERR